MRGRREISLGVTVKAGGTNFLMVDPVKYTEGCVVLFSVEEWARVGVGC